MKRLLAAAGKGVRGPEPPNPFSERVYTEKDYGTIYFGDLGKIHTAASRGQVQKLEKMTVGKKPVNLNKRDMKKRTALHWACVNGHAEVVTFLVDRKCQLNVLDGEGRTPLMKALQCEREACANILIDAGADLNYVDVYGNTALHYAVYSENLLMVATLLSYGAVIEVQNKASLTPLLLAIQKRSKQTVEFLLTKNANANAFNESKCTALMLAICEGSSEIVGMLLQQNVDVFAEDIHGITAERYAAACGVNYIHQQLLEHIRKLPKNPQNTNPEGTSTGTPDEAAPLAERTPDTAESLLEKTPDEAARLVEGTSAKIQCLGKATSGKFEQSTEETPRKILRPTKETSEKFSWPAKERSRKITWEEKETSVKTECVAGVTPNKTEVLEKGTSNMIACPTKETSTKASTNVDVSSVEPIFSLFGTRTIENSQCTKVEEDFNLATKIISKSAAQNYTCLPDATYQKDIKTINHKIEDQMFPSESKREEDEEYSWDSGSLFESSAKTQVCIPESMYQKVMEINREVEELPEKPSAFKPAVEMQKTVPNKAFELKNEQTLRAAQMFPSESKQKDDEENSWDSESPCETVSQKDVYLPKATHQKEFDTLSGKLEESPVKDGLLKPTCGRKVSLPNKALELKDRETFKAESPDKDGLLKPTCGRKVSLPNKALELKDRETLKAESPDNDGLLKPTCGRKVSLPNKALELKDRETFKAAQMFPSESKQKDDEENSWDFESFLETLLQNDVCLPKATHQKEFDTLSGKLEESPDKDGLLKPTCGRKVSLPNKALELKDRETLKAESPDKDGLLKPTCVRKVSLPNKALELKDRETLKAAQMFPSESKQKDDEENSWDFESFLEALLQNDGCLPKATHQKEFDTLSGKLEESPDKDGLLKPTCGMKISLPNKALELKDRETFKAEDVSSVESTFSLFGKPTTENSQSTKVEEDFNLTTKEGATKTVTGQQERDIGIIERAPQDQTNKMPTSELGRKEDTKSTSDSEIISVSDTQNYECLPEATYQKEIKTTNGKIEESPEKPSHFEPATEMQNSVPNKGLEWKNKQTLRADSTTLSKILDALPSCERGRELKKDNCEQITAKMEQTKNKFCVLQKELSEAKEIKSQLENQKAKWEQELCSVRFLTLMKVKMISFMKIAC
ncbi:ankyrin repeat domain-containing protein 30B isoform X1 [Homo sapiens]|uniref:ankyrin repeat domain-containing protein 30B isoform X1 n=1 Tax=Homo sapiens TaxID=9606 RepID=UPI0005D0173C|nr:ankyrin repeat domain-containing protein 30B isoform X1 [Homo sapiens]|eukprot:XP_011523966.1 ankyrin repeat domain-containing protein 30B isoform X2 [Homo sapiens]